MTDYKYKNNVDLAENISEIEVYGQTHHEDEITEINKHLIENNLSEENINQLLEAYKRGFNSLK